MKKPVPFEFVLELIDRLYPRTKPMFGCTAVYIGSKIVFVLRERPDQTQDNGVWIATIKDHHESLRHDLPAIRPPSNKRLRWPVNWF